MDLFVKRNTQARPSRPAYPPQSAQSLKADGLPPKRLKLDSPEQSETDSIQKQSDEDLDGDTLGLGLEDSQVLCGDEQHRGSRTALEVTMPELNTDKDAIEAYETMRASQSDSGEGTFNDIDRRKWVKGRSSIYVDAFNLTLDTVLEDEAHLFDEKEMALFSQWRQLDYEAQYLSVLSLIYSPSF